MPAAVAAAVLVVIGLSGVVVAATHAEPGDPLWGMSPMIDSSRAQSVQAPQLALVQDPQRKEELRRKSTNLLTAAAQPRRASRWIPTTAVPPAITAEGGNQLTDTRATPTPGSGLTSRHRIPTTNERQAARADHNNHDQHDHQGSRSHGPDRDRPWRQRRSRLRWWARRGGHGNGH